MVERSGQTVFMGLEILRIIAWTDGDMGEFDKKSTNHKKVKPLDRQGFSFLSGFLLLLFLSDLVLLLGGFGSEKCPLVMC